MVCFIIIAYKEALWQTTGKAWEGYGLPIIPRVELTNKTNRYGILPLNFKEYVSPRLFHLRDKIELI
jgi:hypothetical protein